MNSTAQDKRCFYVNNNEVERRNKTEETNMENSFSFCLVVAFVGGRRLWFLFFFFGLAFIRFLLVFASRIVRWPRGVCVRARR